MAKEGLSRKFVTIAILLLVMLAPVVILGTVLTFLVITGDLVRNEVTPVEFLELYAIELVLVAVFTYGLYRLTRHMVQERLPEPPPDSDAGDDLGEDGASLRDER